MADQAAKLRELVEEIERKNNTKFLQEVLPGAKRVIGITSGREGVGKTNLAVNLALFIAQKSLEVLLIDSSSNISHVGVVLGLNSAPSLEDIFLRKKKIEENRVKEYPTLSILRGLKEINSLSSVGRQQVKEMIRSLAEYESKFDFLLIDSGMVGDVEDLKILSLCNEIIMVTTPEPTSLMETYSLLKNLNAKNQQIKFYLVVNMVENEEQAEIASNKIISAGNKFLKKDILNLGYIFTDKNIIRAIEKQKPHILLYPYSPASLCIKKIAESLVGKESNYTFGENGFFKEFAKSIKF